jgi:hypothetical protein
MLEIGSSPQGVPPFLAALDFNLSKPMQPIIAGKLRNKDTQAILKELHPRFIPNKIVMLGWRRKTRGAQHVHAVRQSHQDG